MILLIVLLIIPAIWSLIKPGFYEPHDLHHLADIYEMYRAISSGQIPPRLGPDFSFGYGYPLFNFYYLLPFYIGSFFYWISGNLRFSFELVFLISAGISVFGMYIFLRQFFDKYSSLGGALLFLYTPYRAVQIYVRGAMGEMLALSLLPWVFWILVKIFHKPSKKLIWLGSLIIFLFIISHNYFFALSLPFILLFIISINPHKEIFVKNFKLFLITFLFSLSLAAYWLGPAILEKKFVRSETPFPLIDHFPFVKQLVIPSWGYGSSVWGQDDEISFQVGVVNLAVVGVSILLLVAVYTSFIKSKNSKIYFWALGGFTVAFLFMNSRTYFLWKLLPFHNLIQFPWRLLNFTTFFSSILLAFVLELPKVKNKTNFAFVTIILTILVNYAYFRPSKLFYNDDNYYLSRFFDDKNYSEDYLLLPVWTERRVDEPQISVFVMDDATVTNEKEINPINFTAEIKADKKSLITINKDYFPGWHLYVNDDLADVVPSGPHGEFTTTVEKGVSKIQLFWKETRLRKLFDFVSLSTFLVFTYFAIKPDKNTKKSKL